MLLIGDVNYALLIWAANTLVEGIMKLDCVRVKITELGRRALQ